MALELAELLERHWADYAREHRQQLDAARYRAVRCVLACRTPAMGAKVVAKAWTDPAFKKHLLADTRAALAGLGIDIGSLADYRTVENTAIASARP